MAFEDFGRYDAVGLAELVAKREVTPLELVETAIARIERVNPKLNALVTPMYDQARAAAQGELPDGPFRGVPFVLKDLIAMYEGVGLTSGSRFYREWVPRYDSELVRRHRAAGLIVVGKSNTPELGLVPVTEPELHGPTHTPWKQGHNSGGSSGGSGALVGARAVPMAHGGDGGGSIRIPASCCGIFGLKPSRGRIPTGPDSSEQWRGFAIEHVLTLSVRDSAVMLDATSKPDLASRHYAPPPERPFAREVGVKPGKLKIAFTTRPFLPSHPHADTARAVEDAAALLESLGHHVEEATPKVDALQFAKDFATLVGTETAAGIVEAEAVVGRKATRHDFETATWLVAMLGRQISGLDLTMAERRLQALTRRTLTWFEDWDLLLTPTLALPPPEHYALQPKGVEALAHEIIAAAHLSPVLRIPQVVEALASKIFEFIPWTPLANVTGQPSMSVPLWWNDDGLPIGVMLTAKWADEATLFRLAGQLEEARPWRDRLPPIHA